MAKRIEQEELEAEQKQSEDSEDSAAREAKYYAEKEAEAARLKSQQTKPIIDDYSDDEPPAKKPEPKVKMDQKDLKKKGLVPKSQNRKK